MKALYSLNSLFDVRSMPVTLAEEIKLFDTMVSPILSYGSELWGFHSAPDIEKVHLKFLKQVLGVKAQTTNNAVYGDVARFPFIVLSKIKIVKYLAKIVSSGDSLLYKIYRS